ncbi:MAG: hypothetical protein CYPHOPRED_001290 [Cyphobasidiales sp. Tagirdzhanova-0007]|nr:MAG: hypothetical protein CYPHOPRED_001290 [Cyphobasidiales sp. Tagirdzhanova-0007]
MSTTAYFGGCRLVSAQLVSFLCHIDTAFYSPDVLLGPPPTSTMQKRAHSVQTASSTDADDVESSYGDSVTSHSTAPAHKRQRRAGATMSSRTTSIEGKEHLREGRKMRNRISAQLSRDRKKLEKDDMQTRLAHAEALANSLEEENRVLKERLLRNEELEEQLSVLKKRFEQLESLLLQGSTQTRERDPCYGYALAAAFLESDSVCIGSTGRQSSSSLSPMPQSIQSFPSRDYSACDQDDSGFATLQTSVDSIAALHETFLLPATSSPQDGRQEQDFPYSYLPSKDRSPTIINDFQLDLTPVEQSQPYAPLASLCEKEEDLFFGFSYEALTATGGHAGIMV